MRPNRMMLALVGLAATAAGPAMAQDPPTGRNTGRLTYTHEAHAGQEAGWPDGWSLEAQHGRQIGRVTAIVLAGRVARFDTKADRFGLDAYGELGGRRYVNVRVVGASRSDIVARADVYAELFQGLSGGWEPSVGYRAARYAEGTVHGPTVGLGRYVGDDWYARLRGTLAGGLGEGGLSGLATVRRYVGSPMEFVEVHVAGGREYAVLPVAGVPAIVDRDSWTVLLGGQRYVTRSVGVSASLGYGGVERAPDRLLAGVGMLVRW